MALFKNARESMFQNRPPARGGIAAAGLALAE
jgi:hypothetical protein